jgi:deferrochelatase/peroxidase EfeB
MPGDIGDADAATHALQTERAMRHAAMAAGAPDVPREMRLARATPEAGEAEEPERGLHFICLNANISRQFEFVQSTWINDPKFDGLYSDPDPVVAPHRSDSATGSPTFTVPARPVRQRVTDLPQFVTMRGGGYFFLPGIRALRYLATLAAHG